MKFKPDIADGCKPACLSKRALLIASCLAAVGSLALAGPAQAVLQYFVANPINAANECPVCATNATGCGAFNLDTATGMVSYYVVHNQAGENASHVHGPAGVCPAVAGVLFPLPIGMLKVGTYGPLTAAQQADMGASRHYTNIHTGPCGGGAIRGQIVPITNQEGCCLPNNVCMTTNPATCTCLGGVPQGAGTLCTARVACCLPGGACIMIDPLCCDDQGGVSQGTGTACSTARACCLASGACINVDPLCCDEQGGTVQAPGTNCSTFICPQPPQACCLTTVPGGCTMLAPSQCTQQGGIPQGPGTACTSSQACCLPGGACIMIDPICCDDQGGTPRGPGSVCLGDNDNDGIDDACQYKNWVVADDFILGCQNCRCDVNGDGVCNAQDFDCMNSCIFGPPTCDCSRADLNCDGVVDNQDLAILQCLMSGGQNCCPQPLPLTRARWYGSYLDPRFEPPNNTRNIDGWLVALHRDIPAVPCPPPPTGLTPIDLCGTVLNINCAADPIGFQPEGSATIYRLHGYGGPVNVHVRICGFLDPNCPQVAGCPLECIQVMQVLNCDNTVSRPTTKPIIVWAFNAPNVPFINVGKIGCDQHQIWCYQADLAQACLEHNCAGPDEFDPSNPGFFKARAGATYWISIQAEVGHAFTQPIPGGPCQTFQTGQPPVDRDYWGWHTTPPGYHRIDDAFKGMLNMGCLGEWLYNWLDHLHWSYPPYNQCADDPTKSIDMSFCLVNVNAAGGETALWCQPINPGPPPPSDPPYPPPYFPGGGIDDLQNTVADAQVVIFALGPNPFTLNATGPTRVVRGNPYSNGSNHLIDTEIISMSLVGNSPMVGPVQIIERADKVSAGRVTSPPLPTPSDFPADSFFDVFVEIKLPGAPPGFQDLITQVPAHVDAPAIYEVPPKATYLGNYQPNQVQLFDRSSPTNPVGYVLSVRHAVNYRGGIDIHSDVDWRYAPMVCNCPGDVNEDDRLNGLDIQQFVQCLLAPPNPLGCPCDCADMDRNGLLNLADIAPFVNQMLQRPKAFCKAFCP